jgi:DNA-binding winged helix-turn-helix (wHTH) protein
MRFVFADCTLDPDALELRRGGSPVSLSPRGLRLLMLLLERRPRPVLQRELRDALWPQTHVGYTSLAQVVTEVRKAIGDQPGAEELIRTVPRVGYAFVAPVREEPPGDSGSEDADVLGADSSAFPSSDGPPSNGAGNGPVPAGTPPDDGSHRSGLPRRRPWRALVMASALLLAAIAGAWLARCFFSAPPPRFTQLTFRRGVVTSARFSHDGHTVVYSALWDGGPPEVFSRRLDSPASSSLELPPSTLLSVSSKSDLAVLVAPPGERGVVWLGTLATVPLSGGPLRPVLDGVLDADWSPDGRDLAAIRWRDGQFQLEYPLGQVLLRPCFATKLRVSPDGDRVALLDPQGILVVGRSRSTRLAIPAAHQRLAWWDRDSLLVDASESDLRRTLRRVSANGTAAEICALAGTLVVHDVSRDGRVLVHHGFERWGVRARAPGEGAEHDASVYANSQVQGLSADGERILLWDGGEGPPGSALLYPTRGGPPVRLGEGHPLGLSADAAWFVLEERAKTGRGLVLGPTGAGPARRVSLGGLDVSGPFFVSAGSIGINAAERGRPQRSFFVDVDGKPPRALTPEGALAVPGFLPTGEVLARAGDGTVSLHPLSGGEGRRLAWKLPADPFLEAVRTTDGGRFLVVRQGSMPARLDRVEIATGARTAWKTLGPPDATGVGHVWTILVTPDGAGYAYTHGLFLQDLFLVDGLR